ncbi:MAG: phosphoesterase, partial [Terriglobia bacterium]
MKLNLMYHDNCFDGTASAAVFLRFYLEKIHPQAEITLIGMTHQPGPQFHDGLFSADENAIVDFKYACNNR